MFELLCATREGTEDEARSAIWILEHRSLPLFAAG
jgi:hypothetical protein